MEVDGPGSSRGVTEHTNEKGVAGTSIADADRRREVVILQIPPPRQ
jgi:hypothetical protein